MPIVLDGTNGITQADQFNSDSTFGFKNRIINGAMTISQYNGTSSFTPSWGNTFGYLIDRFGYYPSQASKFTFQQLSSSPPVGFSNYLGATVASAVTIGAADIFAPYQFIEAFNTSDLQWGTANAKTVTLSFWVQSSLTGTFGGSIMNSAYNRAYPFTYTIYTANTWTQASITIAGDTSGTWLGATNGAGLRIMFGLGVGSTYSGTAGSWSGNQYWSATGATSVVGTAGATWNITGVQLEVGSTATSFDYRPYGTELQLCQRYYETGITGAGSRNSDNYGVYAGVFKVTKRANPTVTYVASGASGGLGGYYLGPNLDGFVGYSTATTVSSGYYFTYTAAIEL